MILPSPKKRQNKVTIHCILDTSGSIIKISFSLSKHTAQCWQQPGLPFPPTMILSWSLENPFLLLTDHTSSLTFWKHSCSLVFSLRIRKKFKEMNWCFGFGTGRWAGMKKTHKCHVRAFYTKEDLTNPHCTLELPGTESYICKAGTNGHFSHLFLLHSDICNLFDHTPSPLNVNVPRIAVLLVFLHLSYAWLSHRRYAIFYVPHSWQNRVMTQNIAKQSFSLFNFFLTFLINKTFT